MSEPIDPREMRKRITLFSYGRAALNGQPQTYGSTGHAMVRQVLTYAQREGYSGEDTMAMLAYHALLNLEQANQRLLDLAYTTLPDQHPLKTL